MTTRERSGLDRDQVVRVALQLLDEVGLDGLTMRGLADRLGVKAASLYWHLRDKDELQDLLVEAINAELPEPDLALPWRERLECQAWAWRRLLLRHRDAARMVMGRFVTRPNTLRQVELVLTTLRQAGFNDRDAANAGYLFSNFVPGFVAEETMPRPAPNSPSPFTGEGQGGGVPPEGQLEISGARRLRLRGDPALPGLYGVEAQGREPDVEVRNGVVKLRTHGRRASTLVLDAKVPWTISVRGGASQVTADLRALTLSALEVDGGASSFEVFAPYPAGTVPIRVSGGASRLSIHRPSEVPVRLELRGGVSRLNFDGRPFKSSMELTVQSPGYDRVEGRIHASVSGGVSRISVDSEMPESPAVTSRSPEPAAGLPALAPAERYPTLNALTPLLLQASMDERFAFGLRVLLDGLEQRIR